jgi:hypothetical protein
MTSYYNGHEYGDQDGMTGYVDSSTDGSVPSVSLYDFIEEVLRAPGSPRGANRPTPRSTR